MNSGIRWARFSNPLRFKFKHASASHAESSSIIVELVSGSCRGYGEACPSPYVTGDTEASVIACLEQNGKDWLHSICVSSLVYYLLILIYISGYHTSIALFAYCLTHFLS